MVSTRIGAVVWFFAALTFALAISVPNGYGVGVFLLLCLSVVGCFFCLLWGGECFSQLGKDDVLLGGVFVFYALGMFVLVGVDGWDFGTVSRALGFVIAVPVMVLLLKSVGRGQWLWFGVVVGAITAFVVAFYQRSVLGVSRADGGINAILFGNTGMLLGLLSFVGALYYLAMQRRVWVVFAVVGGVCGIAASLLSGTRGGWIVLPFVGFFLLWQGRHLLGVKRILGACTLAFVLMTLAVAVPQTGVQGRLVQAINNVLHYADGTNKSTSVGLRFEMWRASFVMFQESPLLGAGVHGSFVVKERLVEAGVIASAAYPFDHAHNELIHALGYQGVVGFMLLLMLYLVPMRLFLKKVREYPENWHVRGYAMAGVLVPMCYIEFGLSQTMFSYSIGVIMFSFSIVYFWAAMRWAERDSRFV